MIYEATFFLSLFNHLLQGRGGQTFLLAGQTWIWIFTMGHIFSLQHLQRPQRHWHPWHRNLLNNRAWWTMGSRLTTIIRVHPVISSLPLLMVQVLVRHITRTENLIDLGEVHRLKVINLYVKLFYISSSNVKLVQKITWKVILLKMFVL